MPDYSKGKIYTIRFTNDNEIYVGSTIQPLSVRFGEHKRKNNSAVYKHIYDKYDGDFKNCYIELYEEYQCENKEQLHKKEGEITRLIGTLNKCVAGRTKQEYYENNKEIINEKNKKYQENNKEKRKNYLKIYLENNKEILNEKAKIYRENNREIINKKQKEIITCKCGCKIIKNYLERHLKSKKHIIQLDQKLDISHPLVVLK